MIEYDATVAKKAGFNAWSEKLAGRVVVRIEKEGKIYTFSSLAQLEQFINKNK